MKERKMSFTEFFTLRKKQFLTLKKQARRLKIYDIRPQLLKFCNEHPTEINPAPVKPHTIKEFADMRGNIGYRKTNDLMQQFENMILSERRKNNHRIREKSEKKTGRWFHLSDIPKKIVMSDEHKKLFPFGSPIDRSRYK